MKLSELLTKDQTKELVRVVAATSNPLHGGYLPHLFDAIGGFEFKPDHYLEVAAHARQLAQRADPNDPPPMWDHDATFVDGHSDQAQHRIPFVRDPSIPKSVRDAARMERRQALTREQYDEALDALWQLCDCNGQHPVYKQFLAFRTLTENPNG